MGNTILLPFNLSVPVRKAYVKLSVWLELLLWNCRLLFLAISHGLNVGHIILSMRTAHLNIYCLKGDSSCRGSQETHAQNARRAQVYYIHNMTSGAKSETDTQHEQLIKAPPYEFITTVLSSAAAETAYGRGFNDRNKHIKPCRW